MAALVCASASALPAQEPADSAAAGTPEEPRGPEVEAVRFPGADALDRALLEDAIATAATSCKSRLLYPACVVGDWDWAERKRFLDRDEVERDARRLELLYESWGYPEARADARVLPQEDGDVVVEFPVEQGPPLVVEALELRGLDRVSPPLEPARPLPLAEGEPYALPLLEATQERITRALAERGRPYAEVQVSGEVDEAANAARVVLTVEPGPEAAFGPVRIRTEAPIDEEVVRERLAYAPGQPFRPSLLEETQRRLYRLAAVERASVVPVETGDTAVATRIAVTARDLQGLELEGTISSTECLEIAGFYRHRYFLGDPRVFSIGGGFSNLLARQTGGGFPCTSAGEGSFAEPDYFVRAAVRQPWPGEPSTQLLLRAFFTRESVPSVYIRRGYGGEIAVAHDFGDALTVSLGYAPRRDELDASAIYFCGNFSGGFCTPVGIEKLTSFTWLAPIELLALWTPAEGVPRVGRDTLPGGPVWNIAARGGIELATTFTGSEYEYGRGLLEASVTRILGPRIELAARTRVGLLGAGDIVPPQIRLYSGGVNTVRGAAQNLLGPKILVTDPASVDELGCALEPRSCGGVVVGPERLAARPAGGEAVVEANIEARYWLTDSVQLAAFLDYGILWRDVFGDQEPTEAFFSGGPATLLTPGVGLRLVTDIGPIRIDIGYDPSGPRRVPLLTRTEDASRLLFLGDVVFAPFTYDDPGVLTEFWRRLQLHVAVGQPF